MSDRNPYLQTRLQSAADAFARVLSAGTDQTFIGVVQPVDRHRRPTTLRHRPEVMDNPSTEPQDLHPVSDRDALDTRRRPHHDSLKKAA